VQIHGGVKEHDQNEPGHCEAEDSFVKSATKASLRTVMTGPLLTFFGKRAKDAFERELRRSSGLLAWWSRNVSPLGTKRSLWQTGKVKIFFTC
jgi:hypothetical protein